jgi:sugar phosphate isomerase/epimerase
LLPACVEAAVHEAKEPTGRAIQSAIDACAAEGGGVADLPAGRYVTGPLWLKENVELRLEAGATVVLSPNKADWPAGDRAMSHDRSQHGAVLQDAETVIPRLAKLGGRTLGTSVGAIKWGHKIRKTPEQLDAQAELLRTLTTLCEKNGVVLNLHNHTYEVENDLHDLKGTLARIPDAKLGPDLNWLARGGVDPVEFLRQYGKQIVFLHLRDQHQDGRWSEALGEGDMDYAPIAGALREINFQGDIIIELAHESDFKPTRPLRESLKMSREFVGRVFRY